MKLLQLFVVKVYRLLPNWLGKWIIYILKRKYVIGVVAVLPDSSGKFLFLHHTYRRRRPWRMPGGLKERRESVFETIVRELREEANITARALQVIDVQQSEVTFDIAVLCELVEAGQFRPNVEIDALAWVDPADPSFEIPPEQQKLIQTALMFLRM